MPDDQIQREIEFRQTALDDLGRFCELYRRCFGRVVDEHYFRWKYCDNPSGHFVGFEAVHNGSTIASYGVIPEPYWANGARVRVWQSMDTMTDPDYQRRGLFVSLAKQTYAHLSTIDPEYLIVGVPGPMSVRGFLDRLEWSDVGNYPAMFTHAGVLRVAERVRRTKPETRLITSMTSELAAYLTARLAPTTPIATDFTPDFFNWRVFQSQSRSFKTLGVYVHGELVGVCVTTKDDQGWVVVQLLDFHDPVDYARLTSATLRAAVDAHAAHKLYVLEPTDARRRNALRRAGLVVNRTTKGPLTYRQPLIAYNPTHRFHGVDAGMATSWDFQQLMQD